MILVRFLFPRQHPGASVIAIGALLYGTIPSSLPPDPILQPSHSRTLFTFFSVSTVLKSGANFDGGFAPCKNGDSPTHLLGVALWTVPGNCCTMDVFPDGFAPTGRINARRNSDSVVRQYRRFCVAQRVIRVERFFLCS
jgi:hypothetical protein